MQHSLNENYKECGIVLAGGTGSRLHPTTLATNKHLLNVYDKPVIYYPISVLMHAGIRDICLITSPSEIPNFQKLLGDGEQFGITITYLVQDEPLGIAQAYTIASDFINGRRSILILGDNILHGDKLGDKVKGALNDEVSNYIFTYSVKFPEKFGVVELNSGGDVISIEEKPDKPKSNEVAIGVYIFDGESSSKALKLKPSQRGELEITDLCDLYLSEKTLRAVQLGRGFTWLDTGTPDDFLAASNYVQTIQQRQGRMIACLEEIGHANGWMAEQAIAKIRSLPNKSDYMQYVTSTIVTEYD